MSTEDQAGHSTRTDGQMATEIPVERAGRPILLTIAGFDPSSGAGVTADLKVFAAHGMFGMACISALTVQSTQGVQAVDQVGAATVAATLEMLAEDVIFAGIKLGMLATKEICEVVADFLDGLPGVPVVLDPVLRSSSGRELLEPGGVGVVRERLLGRVNWITPNLDELAALTGVKVSGREEIPAAAAELQRLGSEVGNGRLHVLVTGGHLERPDDYLLTAKGETHWIWGERLKSRATHGTGCALSSALLCRLVREEAPLEAAAGAKEYVAAAMLAAYPVGRGKGPMHHLYKLDRSG
jgi:hydroxymethylpyrimidine/phosphomethylpyrimidine kinase